MSDDKNQSIIEVKKQGFLPYLSSFFSGWIFKDMIENEIRAVTKIPKLEAASVVNVFKPSTWKEIGKISREQKGVWGEAAKEIAKHGGIHAASILPGAAFGYLCLEPVMTKVGEVVRHQTGNTQVGNVQSDGKLADTEQKLKK